MGETQQKTKPLPRVILGPDGKPCKPCTAFRNWKPITKKGATAGAAAAAVAATATSTPNPTPAQEDEATRAARCPPDIEVLGRSTWTFLHTTAAYYPTNPTPAHKSSMLGLLNALPVLYPCSHCASHLGENLKAHPPQVDSREALSRWLCERHNDVNVRLGKERFDCDKTDERWKDGPADGSCD